MAKAKSAKDSKEEEALENNSGRPPTSSEKISMPPNTSTWYWA